MALWCGWESLDAPEQVRERWGRSPNVQRPRFASTIDVPLIRRGFYQNHRRDLIQSVILQSAAEVEAADIRQAIVEKNQVWLYFQAAADCRVAVCRCIYIALLALQERLQFIAIRRNRVH